MTSHSHKYFLIKKQTFLSGYVGDITFKSSSCYNKSYTAEKAISSRGSYYCSGTQSTPNCHGVDWWMDFGNKPARITSISFDEAPDEVGAKYIFWGCNTLSGISCVPGSYEQLASGNPQYLSSITFSKTKTFNVYGLTASKCADDTSGCCDGFFASIKNFRFSVNNGHNR